MIDRSHPTIPDPRDMSATEVDRRRQHLMNEIERGVTVRQPWSHPLAVAAALLAVLMVAAASLQTLNAPDTRSPSMVLASVNTAISRQTDAVLYAKETRYNNHTPTTASEGWVDRKSPGVGRVRELNPQGKPVVDSASNVSDGKTVRTDVAYETATVHETIGTSVALGPIVPDSASRVADDEVVNGVTAVHLLGTLRGGPVELWVDKTTLLPVRAATLTADGLVTLDYQWLPRTAEALAALNVPVPADFSRTDTPLPPEKLATVPGSAVQPLPASPQELQARVEELATTTSTTATTITSLETTSSTTAGRAQPATTVLRQTTTSAPTTTTTAQVSTTTTIAQYARASRTDGMNPVTCKDDTVALDAVEVHVEACVALRTHSPSTNESTAVADTRIYLVRDGKKYATADYLVRTKYIEVSYPSLYPYTLPCWCDPSRDYSTVSGAVTYQAGYPATATLQYEIYRAIDPTAPVLLHKVSTVPTE